MKALSVRQPWAWLIIHGKKDIENRKWRTKFTGRFLVHASKQPDKLAMKRFIELGMVKAEDMVYGAIIGSVELTGVTTTGLVRQPDNELAQSSWFQGPIGFILKDPEPLPPWKVKGKLNFFEVRDLR